MLYLHLHINNESESHLPHHIKFVRKVNRNFMMTIAVRRGGGTRNFEKLHFSEN